MELSRLAVGLILISVLSFASAQVDCPAFNVSELGATDMQTQGGLVGSALAAVNGDPSMAVSVQVHDSNIVCLRSGRTRNTYRGVSVVVNYTCTGAPSECTGNPILSQFDFECVAGTPTNPGVRWAASVDNSASNIITTPPDGSLSTTLRTDCGVCISPARSIFATITNNDQHCGSCNSACNTTQPSLMMCFNRLDSGCCNFFENDTCVGSCTSPLVPNSNFDCASPTTVTTIISMPTSTMLRSTPTSSIPPSSTPTSSTPTSSTPTSSTPTSSTPTSSTPTSSTPTSSTPTSSTPTSSTPTSSTPTSSTPSRTPTSMPPNRFDGGKTAGIVVGLVLFLILLVIIVATAGYCVVRKRSRYTKV